MNMFGMLVTDLLKPGKLISGHTTEENNSAIYPEQMSKIQYIQV